MHEAGALAGKAASAAFARFNRPIADSATPAKRSLFIISPQAVSTEGAFRRSRGCVNVSHNSMRGRQRSIGLTPAINRDKIVKTVFWQLNAHARANCLARCSKLQRNM